MFGSKKATGYVGVDIGAAAVRVAATGNPDKNGYVPVVAAASHKIPDGVVEGGVVRDAPAVGRALAEAMRKAGLKRSRPVVIGVANRHTALGWLQLPAEILPHERLDVLRSGRHDISPSVPMRDAQISVNHIETRTTGEGRQMDRLAVAAALTDEIDMLRDVASLAKVTLRAVDLSPAALSRALTRTQKGAHEVATIVDIGASTTVVTTRQGEHLRSMRVIPTGGTEITYSLMEVLDEDFTATEARKALLRLPSARRAGEQLTADAGYIEEDFGFEDDNNQQTLLEEALISSTDHLVEQIATTVAAEASDHPHAKPQAVFLAGGTAKLRGLKDKMQGRLGLPCIIAKPWANLEETKANEQLMETFDPTRSSDSEVLLTLATAIGLSMWEDPS